MESSRKNSTHSNQSAVVHPIRYSSSKEPHQQHQQQKPNKPPLQQQQHRDNPAANHNQQRQQQKQQQRIPSHHAVTLHIRTHPSPPTRPKHHRRHKDYDDVSNKQTPGKQPQQQQQQQQQQRKNRQGSSTSTRERHQERERQVLESQRRLHLYLNEQSNQPLILSPPSLPNNNSPSTEEIYSDHNTVTSQPTTSSTNAKQYYPKDVTDSYSACIQQIGAQNLNLNKAAGEKDTTTTKKIGFDKKQKMTGSLGGQNMKSSKNSVVVASLEAEIPEQFRDTPATVDNIHKNDNATEDSSKNNKKKKKKKSVKKRPYHDLTDIPQTNLSVGLIVFCCFNPLFGAMAIYLSLAAAKAYRDGHQPRGNSRAHWSIVISLFGITITMVIVSTLVVVFSMSDKSNSHYRHEASKAFGL